jgi:hypothetical protein
VNTTPAQPSGGRRPDDLGPTNVVVLCGGMGKRMQQETGGRISKVELPVPLPRRPDGGEASETVLGMVVRTFVGVQAPNEILLLTSDRWVSAHSKLAAELAARYHVDVRCRSDNSTGDEFPPSALADLTEQIGANVDSKRATVLVNGDILFAPQGLRGFAAAVADQRSLIATGVTDVLDYLGLYFFSPDLNWRALTREIAATTIFELMGGLWQRVPVLTVKVAGPIYDCGNVEGYRQACADGRAGKLW